MSGDIFISQSFNKNQSFRGPVSLDCVLHKGHITSPHLGETGRLERDGIRKIPAPFLVAQLVKNLPAMRKTWVPSLGWEDPLEKGRGTHSSILA